MSYVGKRYYGGNEVIDQVEQLAIDRCKELFGCEHVSNLFLVLQQMPLFILRY